MTWLWQVVVVLAWIAGGYLVLYVVVGLTLVLIVRGRRRHTRHHHTDKEIDQ